MDPQYGYQQPVYQQPPYQPPYSPPTNTLALISLIAGILGLTILPTIGSIAGLIMGYIAKRQIEESRGAMGGEGMAKAGIILGWIGVAFLILGLCALLAYILIIFVGVGGMSACGVCATLSNTTY